MRWRKVTLVGVGLLGGSLGMAIKQRRLAQSVVGFVRRAASVKECKKLGAADSATRNLQTAVEHADLIVLCTPIAQMRSLVERMLPWLEPGAIVTDVGSVKASVVRDLEPLMRKAGAHFVGSHPMAGAEKTGVAAARADLFVNAVCVVTPTPNSNRTVVRKVEQFWHSVGSRVLKLPPDKHDELVSRSSHLPHLVAAALANTVLSPSRPKQQPRLCANGFRDTTRIASGSPEMWRDIAAANGKQIGQALGAFIRDLQKLHRVIIRRDARSVEKFLAQAKQRRDLWAVQPRSPSPE